MILIYIIVSRELNLYAPLKIGLETFSFCHEDKMTYSDLYGDVEDGHRVQPDRLQQEDELYGQPGDGEHEGDDRDELHHPPLVVHALSAHGDGPGGLRKSGVRVEHSHWSKSIKILRSDWLRS